jgi:hypothetical protein
MEMAARGDVEIVGEIVARAALRLGALFTLALLVRAVLKARQHEGKAFAHVAEDYLNIREFVEEAARHKADCMARRLIGERPRGANQFGVSLNRAALARKRLAGMKVNGNAQLRYLRPELTHGFLVKVLHMLVGSEVAIPVYEHTFEPEFDDGAFKLFCGSPRILKWNRCKCR